MLAAREVARNVDARRAQRGAGSERPSESGDHALETLELVASICAVNKCAEAAKTLQNGCRMDCMEEITRGLLPDYSGDCTLSQR